MKSFLTSHPTETIIMSYQQEHSPYNCRGSCKGTNCFDNDLFKKEWNAYLPAYMQWADYKKDYLPKLKWARGKVILVPRRHATYGFRKAYEENRWKSAEDGTFNIASASGDISSTPIFQGYIDSLKRNIKKSMNDQKNRIRPYITYLSANDIKYRAWLTPQHIATRVNPRIKSYLDENGKDTTKNYGVVVMDFPPQGLVDEIIKQNPGNHVNTC